MSGQPDGNIYQQLGQLQQSASDTKADIAEIKQMISGNVEESRKFRHDMRGQVATVAAVNTINAEKIKTHGERLDEVEKVTADYTTQKSRLLAYAAGLGTGGAGIVEMIKRWWS